MIRIRSRLCGALIALSGFAALQGQELPPLEAAPYVLRARLAAEVAADAVLGNAIAMSDDAATIALGVQRHDCAAGEYCGAVFVFTRRGGDWIESTRIEAKEPVPEGLFGWSVAISGDGATLLVGAYGEPCPLAGTYCGAAYVYERQRLSWHLVQRLAPADTGWPEMFGFRLALSRDGETAAIGAPIDQCPGEFAACGAAYVYQRRGGVFELAALLQPEGGQHLDFFGRTVALSSDGRVAAFGALGLDCDPNLDCGAIFTAERPSDFSRWNLTQTILAPQPAADDRFGSVALTAGGGRLVGASYLRDCSGGPDCGAAWIWDRRRDTWRLNRALEPQLVAPVGAGFANQVAISDDGSTVVAGAWSETCAAGPRCGSAHVFDLEQGRAWRLPDLPERAENWAGYRVALTRDAHWAAVNVPGESCAGGEYCGAVYLFERSPFSTP